MPDPRLRIATIIALALTVAGWVGVALANVKPWVVFFDNLHWTAGYSAGALLAWRRLESNGGTTHVIGRWTAYGLTALAIGQLVWDAQVAFDWVPFPGPSDLFFLLLGPLMAVGLFQHMRAQLSGAALRVVLLDTAALWLGLLTACLILFLPRQGENSLLQLIVLLAYPLGQFMAFCLIVVLVLSLRLQRTRGALLFPLATLWMAGEWAAWNLRFLNNSLLDGDWLNVGFSGAAVLMGYAVAYLRLEADPDPAWDRRCEALLRSLPLMMVALAAIGIIGIQNDTAFSSSLQILATVGGMLVLAVSVLRQNTLLLERERLLAAERLVSQREQELAEINQALEQRVERRTEELLKANAELKQASAQLMQSEKLAALGGLVAGVSHELNTPIGNIRIAASTLHDRVQDFSRVAEHNQLTKTALRDFLNDCRSGTEILERASERADELIKSFKQVAVDQTVMQRREFDLKQTLEQALLTLTPMLKRTAHQLVVELPPELPLSGYPGAWTQIVTNLLTNSIAHAFDDNVAGEMHLRIACTDSEIELLWEDSGKGIAADIESRIFDPFFTTRFGKGGSGLGLYTVYGIVTGVLGGSIKVDGRPNEGARFIIRAPRQAPILKADPV